MTAGLAGQKPHCLGPRPAWAKEGFMPRGRKEGAGAGGGRQLSGLLPLGPGGEQVPSRMASGLVEGAVPGRPKEGL